MKGLQYDKNSTAPYDDPIDSLNRFYCQQDVAVTVDLYKLLTKELEDWGESIELEHQVAAIVKRQEEHGFKFNIQEAQTLVATLSGEVADIESQLQDVFPSIVEKRVSEKTGKELKDKVTVFNPGSRQQIAERLQGLGVKFKKKTEKGSIIVDEKVLEQINLPEAKLINRYLMLQKRVTQIQSWLEAVKPDGRVHGRVITNGAANR